MPVTGRCPARGHQLLADAERGALGLALPADMPRDELLRDGPEAALPLRRLGPLLALLLVTRVQAALLEVMPVAGDTASLGEGQGPHPPDFQPDRIGRAREPRAEHERCDALSR